MAKRTRTFALFENSASEWTAKKLAAFILKAVSFVRSYESPDVEGDARLQLVLSANADLSPLVFSHREEPRTVLVAAIRNLAGIAPDLVTNAAGDILRRPLEELTGEQLSEVLQLLAGAEFIQGEFIAATAVERFLQVRDWHSARDDFGEAAIYLTGLSAGGMSALTLAQRLIRHDLLRQAGVEATLQMVASTTPKLLALAFRTLQDVIEREIEEEDLYPVLNEIVARSAPLGLLGALAELEPTKYTILFRAAFRGVHAPFELVWLMDDNASEARLSARYGAAAVDLLHLQPGSTGGGSLFWHRSVMRVAGVSPRTVRAEHLGPLEPTDLFDNWRAAAVRFAGEVRPLASMFLASLQPAKPN